MLPFLLFRQGEQLFVRFALTAVTEVELVLALGTGFIPARLAPGNVVGLVDNAGRDECRALGAMAVRPVLSLQLFAAVDELRNQITGEERARVIHRDGLRAAAGWVEGLICERGSEEVCQTSTTIAVFARCGEDLLFGVGISACGAPDADDWRRWWRRWRKAVADLVQLVLHQPEREACVAFDSIFCVASSC